MFIPVIFICWMNTAWVILMRTGWMELTKKGKKFILWNAPKSWYLPVVSADIIAFAGADARETGIWTLSVDCMRIIFAKLTKCFLTGAMKDLRPSVKKADRKIFAIGNTYNQQNYLDIVQIRKGMLYSHYRL